MTNYSFSPVTKNKSIALFVIMYKFEIICVWQFAPIGLFLNIHHTKFTRLLIASTCTILIIIDVYDDSDILNMDHECSRYHRA